jgi:hypothetical protein
MATCPKCGANAEGGFCPSCGANISNVSVTKPVKAKGKGVGIISLVFGCVALFWAFLGVIWYAFALIFSIPAIVLGIIGTATNRGRAMAVIGLVMAAAAIFVPLILLLA